MSDDDRVMELAGHMHQLLMGHDAITSMRALALLLQIGFGMFFDDVEKRAAAYDDLRDYVVYGGVD